MLVITRISNKSGTIDYSYSSVTSLSELRNDSAIRRLTFELSDESFNVVDIVDFWKLNNIISKGEKVLGADILGSIREGHINESNYLGKFYKIDRFDYDCIKGLISLETSVVERNIRDLQPLGNSITGIDSSDPFTLSYGFSLYDIFLYKEEPILVSDYIKRVAKKDGYIEYLNDGFNLYIVPTNNMRYVNKYYFKVADGKNFKSLLTKYLVLN